MLPIIAIGIVAAVLILLKSARSKGLRRAEQKEWAVVTGASSGIGRSCVVELARMGYSVVAISRQGSGLTETVSIAEKEFKQLGNDQSCVAFPLDLSLLDVTSLEQFLKKLIGSSSNDDSSTTNSPHISLLINCAGVSHNRPIPFTETDPSACDNITRVTAIAPMLVTRVVLPFMRKGSTILNIGSFAGVVPSPLLSVYSAAKAHLRFWSLALASELAPKQIHVEHVNTFFVVSAMSRIRRPTFFTPTPDAYVAALFANCRASTDSTPYPSHALLTAITSFIPQSVLIWISDRMHKDIMRRAIAKELRESKKSE